MMLRHMKLNEHANQVENAVFETIREGKVRLSLVHTGEISTSTNARHTHAQNQSSTNPAVYARAYASHLCYGVL